MSHLRNQILHAIAGALTGIAEVELSSVYRVGETELPHLAVFWVSETITADDGISVPRTMDRALELNVRATAASANGLADDLDELCRQIEVALAMPCAAIQGLAKSVTLTGSRLNLTGDTAIPSGDAILSYTVRYVAREDTPDTSA